MNVFLKKCHNILTTPLFFRFALFSISMGFLLGLLLNQQDTIKVQIDIQDNTSRTFLLLGDTKPENKTKGLFIPGKFQSAIKTEGSGEKQTLYFRIPIKNADRFCLNPIYVEGEGIAQTRIFSVRYYKDNKLMEIPISNQPEYLYNKNGTFDILDDGSLLLSINNDSTRFKGQHIAFQQNESDVVVEEYPLSLEQIELFKTIIITLFTAIILILALYNLLRYYTENPKFAKIFRNTIRFALIISIPFLIYLAMELPDKSFSKLLTWPTEENIKAILLGLGLIYLVFFVLLILAGGTMATLILGGFGVFLGIVNQNKIQLRAEPVFPWDVGNITTFMKVAGDTSISFTKQMLISILIIIILASVSVFLKHDVFSWHKIKYIIANKKHPHKNDIVHTKPVVLRACSLIILSSFLVWYIGFFFLGKSQASLELPVWNVPAEYSKQGLAASFTTQFQTFIAPPPKEYTKDNIIHIVNQTKQLQVKNSNSNIKPNIIMVMGESFWDIEKELPGIKYDRELFPNLRHLQETAVSGELLVPVFGGGTVYTEFAALTGFNNKYHTPAPPYSNIVRKPFFSLAQFYGTNGYKTMAMHSMTGSNYTRNIAYPFMGFSETWFGGDDYTFPRDKRSRGEFISDELFVEQIEKQFKSKTKNSDDPLFLFAVTLNNHAKYSAKNYTPADPVSFTGKDLNEEFKDGILDMASTLHSVDKSLGQLTEFVKNQDEPTVLVYFGDHMSTFMENWEDMFVLGGAFHPNTSDFEKNYTRYRTPFIAYSNYENLHQDAGLISANMLMPYVLSLYGLDKPLYFDFLMNEIYPVSKGTSYSGVYLHKDGNYSPDATLEELEAYRDLEMVQYDYFNGKKYGIELFE